MKALVSEVSQYVFHYIPTILILTSKNIKRVYRTSVTAVSPVRLPLCDVPPFSPVSEPLLEWKVGLFSLEPDAAPCRSTQETSAEENCAGAELMLLMESHCY